MIKTLGRIQRVVLSTVAAPAAQLLPVWITPNHLTALRLVLAVPIVYLAMREQWWLSIIIYLLAISTDAIDGELARLRRQISAFGARFDPFVDKVLHIALFAVFWRLFPLLLTILIVLDVLLFLAGLLIVLTVQAQGKLMATLGANLFGKWKLFFQALSIAILFLLQLFPNTQTLDDVARFLLSIAIILSLLSMYKYLQLILVNVKLKSNKQFF